MDWGSSIEFHGIPAQPNFYSTTHFHLEFEIDSHGIPQTGGILWKSKEFYRINFHGIPWIGFY